MIGYSYLSEARPEIARRLPRVMLGELPTPVQPMRGGTGLYVKRDDASHPVYGGNKLRKLEYLFGRARALGVRRVATFGAAGSNHALATALHARRLNIEPLAFLCHQHDSPRIAATLDAHRRLGTRMVYWGGAASERRQIVRRTLASQAGGTLLIPIGGSSIAGAFGYINAAFELAAQCEAGLAPVPERIYVAMGTMGTVAGLAVGLAMARLNTTVVAVRVVEEAIANEQRLERYCERLVRCLARLSPERPVLSRRWAIEVRHDQFGSGYAHPTAAAEAAVRQAAAEFGLTLETTYSGKALAALMADEASRRRRGRPTVFWNTYSGGVPELVMTRPVTSEIPAELERYLGDPSSC